MNAKTLTGAVVGLAVVIILMATLFMPAYSEYTTAEKTYTNEGMPYAAVDDDTHTIVLRTNTITVDNEAIDLSLFPDGYGNFTIVYGVEDFIRYNILSSGNSITLRGSNVTNGSITPTDASPVTITISGSDVTITSTNVRTFNDAIYFISPDGDYVLTANPAVTDDTVMYGEGETSFATSTGVPVTLTLTTYWTGTSASVEATVLTYTNTYTACTVSSTTVNTTNIDGDLDRVDSVQINYTVTYDDTDYSTTSTYTYFLAPAEVTYTPGAYIGDSYTSLLSVLPILVVVSIVIAAVGIVATGRRD